VAVREGAKMADHKDRSTTSCCQRKHHQAAAWRAGGLTVCELPLQGKVQNESSDPLRGEIPELLAAADEGWATILPKWPHFSLPPTAKSSPF